MNADRPLRRLYQALCQCCGEVDLADDLMALESYRATPKLCREERFLLWACSVLDHDSLRLTTEFAQVLNRSRARSLAGHVGCDPRLVEAADLEERLRLTLDRVGIIDRAVPRSIIDGEAELWRLDDKLRSHLKAGGAVADCPDVAVCRRALERLIRFLLVVVLDSGCQKAAREIWSEDLHGFKYKEPLPADLRQYVIGSLTVHPTVQMLRALAKRCQELGQNVPGITGVGMRRTSLGSVESVNHALAEILHDNADRTPVIESYWKLSNALKKLRSVLREVPPFSCGPWTIQLYREVTLGHLHYYEGLDSSARRVRLFAPPKLELHVPYHTISRSYPDMVAYSCVRQITEFLEPV